MSPSFNELGALIQLDSNNELKNGLEESFYENGTKMFQCFWKDGVQNGLMTRWWENGKIATEGSWKSGVLHGKETELYEWGTKQCETIYEYGKVVTKLSWKPNGEKCDITDVTDGTGIYIRYRDDGDKVMRKFKDGLEIYDDE